MIAHPYGELVTGWYRWTRDGQKVEDPANLPLKVLENAQRRREEFIQLCVTEPTAFVVMGEDVIAVA